MMTPEIQRMLSLNNDNPALSLTGGSSANSASMKFTQALMQMLSKYQNQNFQQSQANITDLQRQGLDYSSQQALRQAAPATPGMSPSQQSAIRSADVSALNPSIEGTGARVQGINEQLKNMTNMFDQAQTIAQWTAEQDKTTRTEARDLVFNYPSAVKAMSDKERSNLLKSAGVEESFLDKLISSGVSTEEKWVDETMADGSLAQRNSKTGELKVIQKATDTTSGQSLYSEERSTRIVNEVDSLMSRVNKETVGLQAMLTSRIPSTKAYDFQSDLSTIRSNIMSGELTAMREASKTGGALGNVSDKEGIILQNALGSLDIGQSPEQFKKNLQKIKDSLARWAAAVNQQSSGGVNNKIGGSTTLRGPDGILYSVPNQNVDAFIKAGGTRQ